jgi:hypothetical protein
MTAIADCLCGCHAWTDAPFAQECKGCGHGPADPCPDCVANVKHVHRTGLEPRRPIKVGPNKWYHPTPPRQSDIDYERNQHGSDNH